MAEKVELRAAHAAVMDTMETRAKELDRRHALGAEQLSSLAKAEASARELLRQELSETGNYDAVLQVYLRRHWADPLPHLDRDWAYRCHICTGTGLAAPASVRCHVCTGTGLF